jgi:chitinase
VGEADGVVNLPITLSAPSTGMVSVSYSTSDSSASSGSACNSNYVAASGTLNFAAGQTTQSVPVNLLDCLLPGFRSFTFNLASPTGAAIARASTRVGIVGDGNVTSTPGLYLRDATVDNGAGTINVPVLLGGPAGTASASTVTVNYTTQDGTATAGTDYTAASGTLTFAPGRTVQNIPVAITNRTGSQPARRFTIVLSQPSNATVVHGTGIVTIGASGATPTPAPSISAPPDVVVSESDGYVDLPVTLAASGQSPVAVSYTTADSSASAGPFCPSSYVAVADTLNFAAGETTKTVRVDLLNCPFAPAGFKSFTFNLGAAVNGAIARASTRIGIIIDPTLNATPGLYVRDAVVDNTAGVVNVPVLLGGLNGFASSKAVSVNYATEDGTASAGADYTATSGTLTFGPGQTVQNIPVAITGRTDSQPARRFAVTLSSPANATVADGVGVVVIGASGGSAVASPSLAAPPDLLVGEADGYVDLPVTLSTPGTNQVSVSYGTANGSAQSGVGCGANYVGVDGTLNFLPGETTQTVRIDLLSCGLPSPGAFTFNLSAPINGTIVRASTTISIVQTPGPPDAPTGASAVPGNQAAVVTFAEPASDGGNPINSYTVTASPGGAIATGISSPLTVTGLTNGDSYTFTVTATNAAGPGPLSAPSGAVTPFTVPDAPAINGTTPGNAQATVSFTPPAFNGGAAISSYTVTASPGGAFATGSSSPLTVTGLTNGNSYTFTVTATNAAGPGRPSTPSTAVTPGTVPSSPTGLAAVRGDRTVTLSWKAAASSGGSVTYNVYMGTSPGKESSTPTSSTSQAAYTVNGLSNGTTYYFVVMAHNAVGVSRASNEASTTPAPSGFNTGPGAATDISVGANGSVWVIGTNVLPGGYGIYKWNGTGWTKASGAAVKIAVDQRGNPWVINSSHHIYHWSGTTWIPMSGAATDISVGANGSVWAIGTNVLPGGYGIYKWNGTGWTKASGAAVNIAVNPHGIPWIIDPGHHIYIG